MYWVLAKIALFIAIIWAPAPIAVIPTQTPISVASTPIPHVIIKAMPTTPDVPQKAENSPQVIVQPPEVALQPTEIIEAVPVVPGPAGTPVQETNTAVPQINYKTAGPDVGGHYDDAGVPFTGYTN